MFKVGLGIGAVLIAISLIGCGSKTPVADKATNGPATATPAAARAADGAQSDSPTVVVSEFLDRVRRGGAAQVEAARLLTTRAQAECQRTGLKMDSMGAPDARFEVTRSEMAPDSQDTALVHSLWTEPTAEGTEVTSEVVWVMQQESAGWRISGLFMESEPGSDPIVINFEDGDQAAAVLGLADTSDPEATQATLPGETTPR